MDNVAWAWRIKNDQRGVENEPELLEQLEDLLQRRGLWERLLIFHADNYTTIKALKNVMATVWGLGYGTLKLYN